MLREQSPKMVRLATLSFTFCPFVYLLVISCSKPFLLLRLLNSFCRFAGELHVLWVSVMYIVDTFLYGLWLVEWFLWSYKTSTFLCRPIFQYFPSWHLLWELLFPQLIRLMTQPCRAVRRSRDTE